MDEKTSSVQGKGPVSSTGTNVNHLVDEYRIRLHLDSDSYCTLTSNNPQRVTDHISTLLGKNGEVEFQPREDGISVSYMTADGQRIDGWISRTRQPRNQTARHFNELRRTSKAAA